MLRVPQKQIGFSSRNLRRLRAEAGLTQEALAEKADLTTRYLQQLEAAQFGASLAVLIRLRGALDYRWDSLLEKIEERGGRITFKPARDGLRSLS